MVKYLAARLLAARLVECQVGARHRQPEKLQLVHVGLEKARALRGMVLDLQRLGEEAKVI